MFFPFKIRCCIEELRGTLITRIYAESKVSNLIFIENKEQIYGNMLKSVLKLIEIAKRFGGINIEIPLIEVTPIPNQIIVSTYILFKNPVQKLLFFNELSNEIPNGEYVN